MKTVCKHSKAASGTGFSSAYSKVSTATIYLHLNTDSFFVRPYPLFHLNILWPLALTVFFCQRHPDFHSKVWHKAFWSLRKWQRDPRCTSIPSTFSHVEKTNANGRKRRRLRSYGFIWLIVFIWPYRAFAVLRNTHPLIIPSLFWCKVWKDDRGRGLKGILLKQIVRMFFFFFCPHHEESDVCYSHPGDVNFRSVQLKC